MARKTVLLRANEKHVRLIYQGREAACHDRCYDRGQPIIQDEHQLAALKLRSRVRAHHVEESFDALGVSSDNYFSP